MYLSRVLLSALVQSTAYEDWSYKWLSVEWETVLASSVGTGIIRKPNAIIAENPAMPVGANTGPRLHAVGNGQQRLCIYCAAMYVSANTSQHPAVGTDILCAV